MVTNSQSCSNHSFSENRIFRSFGQIFFNKTQKEGRNTNVHLPLMLRNSKIKCAFSEKHNEVFLVVRLYCCNCIFVQFQEDWSNEDFLLPSKKSFKFVFIVFCSSLNFIINLERLGCWSFTNREKPKCHPSKKLFVLGSPESVHNISMFRLEI